MNLIEVISVTNPNMIVDAWNVFIKYKSLLLIGVRNTLIVALIGTLVGLLIGLVIGAIRAVTQNKEASDSAFIRIIKKIGYLITSIYVSIF
ncbi:MAG TPA: amino acid ABC transporter permease, partial [Dielma fastidiosa]|nr:amino acid ABC transporter permease [Dielma fastidiosa]